MITIHHLGVSQSDRIVWLMEELGLPYKLDWYDRGPDRLAPPEYVALHPAAMAPVITDGSLVLAESTAIVQYLAHKYGGGRFTVAPNTPHYADYLYWLQFNNNVLGGFFVKSALKIAGDHDGGIVGKLAKRRSDGLFRQMDRHLQTNAYLAGDDFTLADLMSGFALTTLVTAIGQNLDELPQVKSYAQRLMNRPAWQKAMAIAGPSAKRPAN